MPGLLINNQIPHTKVRRSVIQISSCHCLPESEAAAFVLIKRMVYLRYTDAALRVVVSVAISNTCSIQVIDPYYSTTKLVPSHSL